MILFTVFIHCFIFQLIVTLIMNKYVCPTSKLCVVSQKIYLWSIEYTGWRKINRTIQTVNRVYENLREIRPFTLGAKVDSSYYCDVVLNQGLLPEIQKLSGNNFTFSTGWCAISSFTTNSCVFASPCARICEKLATE